MLNRVILAILAACLIADGDCLATVPAGSLASVPAGSSITVSPSSSGPVPANPSAPSVPADLSAPSACPAIPLCDRGASAAVDAGDLARRIDRIVAPAEAKKARFGIHFRDLQTARTIYSHNADQPFIPASNMKLVTTAASLDLLGADFVYETTFAVADGRLVIVAGGDPLLGDPVLAERGGTTIDAVFQRVLEQLAQRKIAAIDGGLLVDNTLFDEQRFHPSWPVDQANKWYAAQVSALCFNNNCIDITIFPSATPGRPGRYTLSPNTVYANITNKSKTVRAGRNTVWASRHAETNDITLHGNARYEHTINVAIDRPSAFFGFVLSEYLMAHGVKMGGRIVVKALPPDAGLDVLFVHRTRLSDVLARCNQRSLNLAAECLFKTLGAHHGGEDGSKKRGEGSWQSGRRAVNMFLTRTGADCSRCVIDDGSGLSRQNRLTADTLTSVLAHMHTGPSGGQFRASLANSANGTLAKAHRFSEPFYSDRLFAKTGWVSGAWALSGYCRLSSGGWAAFSILANRPSGRSLRTTVDKIVKEVMK